MSFWTFASHDPRAAAVVDDAGATLTYGELDERVAEAAQALAGWGDRQLGMLLLGSDVPGLVAYLACFRAGHVPLLLGRDMTPALLEPLLARYQPAWVMGAGIDGTPLTAGALPIRRLAAMSPPLHDSLGLLLGTSGSTGSAKLVRLSREAVAANARSIASFLRLGPGERALTVLPPHYSYGLSVINSHLASGACLVARSASVLTPAFTAAIREHEVTSISGVPTTYQMLWRAGFQQQALPSLRTLTQAGGRLDEQLTRSFSDWATERGLRFVVMYGQTEATARISYVPPEKLQTKVGSIGIAIPEGHLQVDAASGELVYRGPNVMLGYAECADDLAKGDEVAGVLRTGDLGRQDEDGYFYVTGRLKRFIKLAGNRVSLDDIEILLQRELQLRVAVAGADDNLCVAVESSDPAVVEMARVAVGAAYGFHRSLVRVKRVDHLPLLASGKTDYAALT